MSGGEQTKKITENKEITDIKKILGLETGKKIQYYSRYKFFVAIWVK
jgi:DNA gyrase/topoisomerase IV subunit B